MGWATVFPLNLPTLTIMHQTTQMFALLTWQITNLMSPQILSGTLAEQFAKMIMVWLQCFFKGLWFWQLLPMKLFTTDRLQPNARWDAALHRVALRIIWTMLCNLWDIQKLNGSSRTAGALDGESMDMSISAGLQPKIVE